MTPLIIYLAISTPLIIALEIYLEKSQKQKKDLQKQSMGQRQQPIGGFYQRANKWSVTLDGESVSWWKDKQETAQAWHKDREAWFAQGKTYGEWLGIYRHNKSKHSRAYKEFYRRMDEDLAKAS